MTQEPLSGEVAAERSKFAVGGDEVASIDTGELPWSYGENRITAMVRDPDSAYLYWEITDDGIAAARGRLGPGGVHGWLTLRVYDTTGRAFDGTNANDYFDVRVDRNDREYFLMIRRPTSSMHAEIGVKTTEGFFQAIARSGRADFPRNLPSPSTELEWMTVTSDYAPPAAAPFRSRYAGPEPPLPGREGAGYVDVWRAGFGGAVAEDARPHPSWSSTAHRTFEHRHHIERWWHLTEWRAEWRAGLRFAHWEGWPDPERVVIELLGDAPLRYFIEGGHLVAYGPWRVEIKSFEHEPERRVLATWSMRWVKASTAMIERWGMTVERRRMGAYERSHFIAGASEQRLLVEGGASEVWRMGASERMWLGASEWLAGGASETLLVGASQLAFAGASALLYARASEQLGASERWRASVGASEWVGGSGWVGGSAWVAGEHPADPPRSLGERWAGRPGEES
jgi:hypothetical protein